MCLLIPQNQTILVLVFFMHFVAHSGSSQLRTFWKALETKTRWKGAQKHRPGMQENCYHAVLNDVAAKVSNLWVQ